MRPWLEEVIVKEVKALLDWEHAKANPQGTRRDTGAVSYSNDGATLTNTLSSTSLRRDCPVQLAQVRAIATEDSSLRG